MATRRKLSVLLIFALTLLVGSQGLAQTKESSSAVDAETKALHDKLAKYLSGTKWKGNFTVKGKDSSSEEHYEILTAEKAEEGDYWNLVARIKYGGKDSTIPLPPIEIKFAGKTPVITVDNAFFPGFGSFDARVLIRKGQYAGTWAHSGGIGGHMFGTIEKMTEEEIESTSKSVKKPTKSKSKPSGGDKK